MNAHVSSSFIQVSVSESIKNLLSETFWKLHFHNALLFVYILATFFIFLDLPSPREKERLTSVSMLGRILVSACSLYHLMAAVALMQIYAYSMHTNLAVCCSCHGRDGYSVRQNMGLNTSQTKHDANDQGIYCSEYVKGNHASFAKNILFRWIWKMLLKCGIHFSISFRWYAFPNFCAPISRPLVYRVRISSKASATADNEQSSQPIPSLSSSPSLLLCCPDYVSCGVFVKNCIALHL